MSKILFVCLFALLFVGTFGQDCLHARILGATYGLADVTSKIAHDYNLGIKSWTVDNTNFGNPLPNKTKVLTVVYEICQNVATITAKEDTTLVLP